MQAGAPQFTGTLTVAASTAAQQTSGFATIALPGETGELFDASSATLVISNGADQTITAASVVFRDVVAGKPVSIPYAASTVSVAAGSAAAYYIAVNAGVLRFLEVSVTFTTAPTAGKVVAFQVTLQS